MHDLRHDPNAHAVDERTRYDLPTVTTVTTPTATGPAQVLTPEQLRTVPMPNLRSGTVRAMDAQARGLDCRTGDEKTRAELVRIVDCLQAVSLRQEWNAADIADLRDAVEYVALHLERMERAGPPRDYMEQVDYWNAVQHFAAQRLGELSAVGGAV